MLLKLAAIVGCLAGLQLLYRVFKHVTSPLRSVPGPFLARFTDLWYFRALWKAKFEVVNKELHQKYGPIIRYGPNRYSFDDVTAAKTIYSHGTQFAKSDWYEAWSKPGVWNLFAERDITQHSKYRRQFQTEYSMSSLVEYEPFVDECAAVFDQRLQELSQCGLPVNMGHWMQCYAFDVIGCITFSKRLGFLDQGLDIGGVISAIENALVYSSLVGIYPFLHPYLFSFIGWLVGGGTGYVFAYTTQCMEEHQAAAQVMDVDEKPIPGRARDFISKFVAKHHRDPDVFTPEHIMEGCSNNMIAGSDTTAISLSAILYYLLKNPNTLAKLREEVKAAQLAAGTSSKDIPFKMSQAMPYLQAVIKEALRMHPATGLPIERVVPVGGATIAGRFFPQGSVVGVNTWIEHRNPRIFGEDANEFKPERWLSDDTEKVSFMNRHWMPFGLGSRTCIGRHISHLEISKLIPRLVRDYDFELAGDLDKNEWKTDNYWFVKPTNFSVRIIARKGS
ncbi:cytochrome P450 [Annulohypoxylon maeteangense]|uniref:cytochrome P450 n=1 Tax=Annulohypoxylon maeteangense TaxID=1927788 RepID=UPI002007F40F|nr:cytochrome P450 [Annulohypoxylon maeteangense]KAI0888741.1 cytochrome P450 [Annulohypoxylon maeteangense]